MANATRQPLFIIGASFIAIGVGTAIADPVNAMSATVVTFLRTTFNLGAALPPGQTGAILFGAIGFFLMALSAYRSA